MGKRNGNNIILRKETCIIVNLKQKILVLLRDIPNIPPTLNRDLPVEGKNNERRNKKKKSIEH